MKQRGGVPILSFIVLVTTLCESAVGNGDRYDFLNRKSLKSGQIILPNAKNRGLVAQFMDPDSTGLGKSLGFLVRGEVRTAIGDPKAGIIVAYQSEGKNIAGILEETDHLGALDIAREDGCYMALWGVVWEGAGQLFFNTFLSVLPEVRN